MKKTHYEQYLEKIAPHTKRAKEVFDLLASNHEKLKVGDCYLSMSQLPGIWARLVMEQHGQAEKGNRVAHLFRPGSTIKEANAALDAFLWRIYAVIYEQDANEDGSYSLSKSLFTNFNFLLQQQSISYLADNAQAQTCAEIAYHLLSHERAGKKVYEVADGLAEKLKYTELRGLQASDARLPYSNIYISVPEIAGFSIYNDSDNQWHDLIGVYITEDKNGRREPMSVFEIKADNQNKLSCTDDVAYESREVVRTWSILFVGGPGKDSQGNPIPNDDALFFFRLYLPEGKSIEECIFEVGERNTHYDRGNQFVIDKMENRWSPIFRWCLNVMFYATCADPDEDMLSKEAKKLWQRIEACPEGSKTRANLKKKLDSLKSNRVVLGSSIAVDRTKPESLTHGSTGRKITIRTRVAGHWRKVRWGKNWSERRMKFIEPFWRGPELGKTVSKKHILK